MSSNNNRADQVLDILGDVLPAEPVIEQELGGFVEGNISEGTGDHGGTYGEAMCLGPELTNQTDLGSGYGEDGAAEFSEGKLVYYGGGRGRQYLGDMESIHVVRKDGTFTLTGIIRTE